MANREGCLVAGVVSLLNGNLLYKLMARVYLLRIKLLFYYNLLHNVFQDVVTKFPTKCDVEWMDAEDPLFLLYTSGSTGKPKVLLVELD